MNLAETIIAVQAKNEKTIAARIAAPILELDAEARQRLAPFIAFCKEHGCRYLPASPAVIAQFISSEHEAGIAGEDILKWVQAIELLHAQDINLANPVAVPVVSRELQRVLRLHGPRCWSKAEHEVFMTLPIPAQMIITRRDRETSNAVRKAQNEAAELRKQLKSLTQKEGTENDEA